MKSKQTCIYKYIIIQLIPLFEFKIAIGKKKKNPIGATASHGLICPDMTFAVDLAQRTNYLPWTEWTSHYFLLQSDCWRRCTKNYIHTTDSPVAHPSSLFFLLRKLDSTLQLGVFVRLHSCPSYYILSMTDTREYCSPSRCQQVLAKVRVVGCFFLGHLATVLAHFFHGGV